MAQQNVPSAATESSIEISDIRSAFKAMLCDDLQDYPQILNFWINVLVFGHLHDDVDFWLKAVDSLDDEEILKCDKIFETFKKLIKPVIGLGKEQADDDEKAVRASNLIKSYDPIFARLAVKSCLK